VTEPRADHFFDSDGDSFIPTGAARGYWQDNTLSGSAAASLLGFVIERDFCDEGWVPVRLSIDMVRMPPAAALSVETDVLHESGRLRLVEARLMAQGRLQTRALCQIVRQGSQPANSVWQSPAWPAPHPDTLPAQTHWRWDMRPIPADHPRFNRAALAAGSPGEGNPPVLGRLAPPSARQAWLNVAMEIVAGHPLSRFAMLVTTADFASPLTHSSEFGIDFVNTDFTIHCHRLPQGDWLGYELVGHSSADGIAVGQAAIHDLAGPLGVVVVSAIANSRRK
jgi:hypothetical protein